jgi:hypothetical protein
VASRSSDRSGVPKERVYPSSRDRPPDGPTSLRGQDYYCRRQSYGDESGRGNQVSSEAPPVAARPSKSECLRGTLDEKCLSKIMLFGEGSLRRAMHEYISHDHSERNHQGTSNVLLFPQITEARGEGPVRCRERLGGSSCAITIKTPLESAGKFGG